LSFLSDINFAGVVQKHMIEQNYGKIINLSSPIPPSVGSGGQTSYATATARIHGFTVALARELGPYNINVNCIAPDYIDTEMTRDAARREGLYLAYFKELVLSSIPLRRLGSAEDVASLARFLSSDDSGFISGQTIHVKGGL
jgi:3-oxoacyl-[acyl-carrier protein] reductase